MGDKQAEDLVILDLRPVSLITDFFVIGTAGTARQIRAVTEAAIDAARRQGEQKPALIEGTPESGWVLVDFGDIIAHVFDPDRRAFYGLESIWDQAVLVARMA